MNDSQTDEKPVDELPKPTVWLDERGKRCPIPIITLSRARFAYGPDVVIALMADDPAADIDVPAWCRLKGATFHGRTSPKLSLIHI